MSICSFPASARRRPAIMNDQPPSKFNSLSGFISLSLIYHFALRIRVWLPTGITWFRPQ
jgi:hypothetical protein